jgi:hypothetical protein
MKNEEPTCKSCESYKTNSCFWRNHYNMVNWCGRYKKENIDNT